MTLQHTIPLRYEQDYCRWLEQTIQLLRDRNLSAIDYDNLIEELEDMGRSQKDALYSNLKIVFLHLLKWQYQPSRRSNSWRFSIREHRQRLHKAFKDSPSLKNYYINNFEDCYADARELAADETGLSLETFPVHCPFNPDEVMNADYISQ